MQTDGDETTEKYGLEAGLLKVMTSSDEEGKMPKGAQAKELLKRYGSAYLITSISFALVSFAACYAAVNSGALGCVRCAAGVVVGVGRWMGGLCGVPAEA